MNYWSNTFFDVRKTKSYGLLLLMYEFIACYPFVLVHIFT